MSVGIAGNALSSPARVPDADGTGSELAVGVGRYHLQQSPKLTFGLVNAELATLLKESHARRVIATVLQ
jgi:hypothetical protein